MWWRLMSCISRSLIFFLESRKSGPYQSINVFSPLSWLSRYNLTFFSFLNALFFPLPELYSFNPFSHLIAFFFFPFCLAWTWLINLFSFIIFTSTIFIFKCTIFRLNVTQNLTQPHLLLQKLNMVSRINMSSSITLTSSICDPDCESWKDVSLWIFLGQQARWLVGRSHLSTGTHQLERPLCMGYIVPCGLIA